MTFPSSASSGLLPPWPLFLFLSVTLLEDARLGAGVGGRGGTSTTGTAGDALPM